MALEDSKNRLNWGLDGGHVNVLCVDDDADFLALTLAFLERKLPAATIRTATGVEDALDVLATEPIHCVVSDYDMPGRNGLDFLRTVREDHPDLPFILFTGKGSEEIASDAISAGVTDYLQKRGAVQYDRLAVRIRNAVTQYQAERELEERVKELTAIGTIRDLLAEETGRSAEQLQRVVDQLPQSFQVPDRAVARLTFADEEFLSPAYETPAHRLSVRGVTTTGDELTLTVGYVGTPEFVEAPAHGDPFLPEEQELLETVLQLLSAHFDRRHVVEKLTEADRRLRLILENTNAVMYLKDQQGRYVFANTEYERLFDLGHEEAVGRMDHEIHPPEMADEVQNNDRRVLETGAPIETEERIDVGGEMRTYLSCKVPATNDAGDIEGVFGVSTDITDRKERERQLEALNHAIRQLLSADSHETVAERGVEAARKILGLKANAIHLYDEAVDGLVPVAETDFLAELIDETPTFTEGNSTAWRVYEAGEATAIPDVRDDPDVYNPDTTIRSELYLPLGSHGILVAGSPTPSRFDRQDVTVGELLAAHLVSAFDHLDHEQQLRDREVELTRQNERLDEFSSMVSHDLRNPISIATGHLELYRESGDEGDLDHIERAIGRIDELVTDLTTIARHGSTDDERERVSLPDVANDAWNMIDTRSATLSTTASTITGDRSQLQGLFENLFRNAVGHGGADVTVRVGPLDDGFYVEDTGSGIPAEQRERVFEQGYTTGYGGSGIGLTIVNRIAQAHGLKISLAESADGGARFEFYDTDQ